MRKTDFMQTLTTTEYYNKTIQLFGEDLEQALRMLCGINGYTKETINQFIDYWSGYRNLDQYIECERIEYYGD